MSQTLVQALTNCNIYVNGVGFIGRAAEVEVPHPKQKLVDYKGLGMAGSLKLWAGVEALEAQIKWSSYDAAAIGLAAMPFKAQQFQVRGSLMQQGSNGVSAELPVIYLMTGAFHDGGKAAFKQHEMVETTSMINVTHTELYIAGAQVYLFDAFANIYVVNGVDQLAQFRSNIGG